MSPRRPALMAFGVALLALALGGCNCGGLDPGEDAGTQLAPNDCVAPFSGQGTILTPNLDGPRRLAADDAHLYVTEAGALAPGEGRLTRIAKGGWTTEVLARHFDGPHALVLDADYAFLLDHAGVWRVNKGSFQSTLIAEVTNSARGGDTDLAQSGDTLFVATGLRWLVRMKKDGTARADVYTGTLGTEVRAVAVDGPDVFFLVGGGVAGERGLWWLPLDGSAAPVRLSTAPGQGRSLTVTPERFLWTEADPPAAGRLRALARTGGSTAVTLAGSLQWPLRPVEVEGFVYFQERTPTSASSAPSPLFLRRTAICDPVGAAVVGPLGYGPGDLLVSDGFLYFTSVGLAGTGHLGRVP